MNYTDINSKVIDKWVGEDWEWGRPISSEVFNRAKSGDWSVVLTPTKPVPKEWFCDFNGSSILGLASGGGQQMPIFAALEANCTVLDYSAAQLESEKRVSEREGYAIRLVQADMSKPLPFEDEAFDLIFHPVSNVYIEDVLPVWKECHRILKKGGILLSGLDNGLNFAFDDEKGALQHKLPFNPLRDKELYEESMKNDWGIQFSHTIEEQIGGQLRAGFTITDIFQDTNNTGKLYEYDVPAYYAARAVKM